MEFFKKRSTAWVVLIAVIVVSFFIGQARRPASQVQILPAGEYVQDNANVLSASTEKHMTELNNDLVSKVGGEIHVVTVDTVGSEDIFSKAIDLANDTNLSASSCIFFIAVDDIDAVIVQGNELIYAFSDDELSALLQYHFTEDDFRTENVDAPARRVFDDLITMYEEYYDVSITGRQDVVVSASSDDDYATMVAIYLLIVVLIILIVYVATRPRRYSQRTVVVPGPTVHRTGNYPPRGSYNTPPPYRPGSSSHRTSNRGGSFSSSASRTGGFGSSSRGGSFSSGSSSRGGSFSSSRSSFGGSSRSGGFGGGSRGGSFGGGSRGGGFRK